MGAKSLFSLGFALGSGGMEKKSTDLLSTFVLGHVIDLNRQPWQVEVGLSAGYNVLSAIPGRTPAPRGLNKGLYIEALIQYLSYSWTHQK